jgi:hypothetical protein
MGQCCPRWAEPFGNRHRSSGSGTGTAAASVACGAAAGFLPAVHRQPDLTKDGRTVVDGRGSGTGVPGVFAAGGVIGPAHHEAVTAAASRTVFVSGPCPSAPRAAKSPGPRPVPGPGRALGAGPACCLVRPPGARAGMTVPSPPHRFSGPCRERDRRSARHTLLRPPWRQTSVPSVKTTTPPPHRPGPAGRGEHA